MTLFGGSLKLLIASIVASIGQKNRGGKFSRPLTFDVTEQGLQVDLRVHVLVVLLVHLYAVAGGVTDE